MKAESIAFLISVLWHSFNSRWIVGWGIKTYLGAAESIAFLISVLWHCFNSRWIVGWAIKLYLGPAESIALLFFVLRHCFNTRWIMGWGIKPYLGPAESIALLIFVLWHSFNSRWILGWGIKSYLGPAEIASFSFRYLSRCNKHDLFWLVISARYLYILFLWAIVLLDFLPLEIYKHLRAESIAFLIFVLWHCFNRRWIVGWSIKSYLGAAESVALLISVLWHCLNSRSIVGVGIKSYSGRAETASISCRYLSRRNKHDLFLFVVSARYFYILFLWVIVVSDFLPLEIDKHLRAESIALLIFVLWHCFNSWWIVGWGIKSYLELAEIIALLIFILWHCFSSRCIVGWGIKSYLGPAESIPLLIFVFWNCLNGRWIVSWGIKSYFRPAEIASFSCRDLNRRNKHDLFWLVGSARYLSILFLWAIVVSDFLPFEIHKHLRADRIALLIFVVWYSFNSRWIVCWGIKSELGPQNIALLIFVLWHCFNSRWIMGWGKKFYLGPAEIVSFSCLDLSRLNKLDLFWLVVSARYLYILFLWDIVGSDFVPLEIHKHLRAESIPLLTFFFGIALIVGGLLVGT